MIDRSSGQVIKILFCEDNEDMRSIISEILELELENVEVHTLNNGLDAINLIQSGFEYTVIISDNEMPKATGVDLFIHLRNIGDTTPFILATSTENPFPADESLQYLPKPYDITSLIYMVKNNI